MLPWFRRLTRRRPTSDELLNEGLELAMDWGGDWLSPINGRLHALHPYLGANELEESNVACQGAMRLAYETVHALLHGGSKSLAVETLAPIVRDRYPWVSQENLVRLLNQGVYYAAKMGGHAPQVERDL